MKKTYRDNYRLEVEPDTRHVRASELADHGRMMTLLDDIKRDIVRHVDGVDQIVYRFDIRYECSFCGLAWEVMTHADALRDPEDDTPVGMPVCCREAQDEWREENAALCTWTVRYATLETPEEQCDLDVADGEDYCTLHLQKVRDLETLVETARSDA